MPNRSRGISTFLERYCPDPVGLEAAFQRELRVQTLHEGQALCSGSDEADCLWIVDEGLLQVMAGSTIARRGPGEIIGEMAFLRGAPGSSPVRGNDVVAASRSKVWRIDRSTIDGLAGETRALWYETVARALVAKLDEASLQRASQARDLNRGDRAIARLVCPEGDAVPRRHTSPPRPARPAPSSGTRTAASAGRATRAGPFAVATGGGPCLHNGSAANP